MTILVVRHRRNLAGGSAIRSRAPRLVPKVERNGNVAIITFIPDSVRDVENVLARELGGLTAGLRDQHLLLDFSNVDALNSMELGTIINLHKQLRDAGGWLTLFNLSTDVLRLFTISHLDTLLQICREDVVSRSKLPSPIGERGVGLLRNVTARAHPRQ